MKKLLAFLLCSTLVLGDTAGPSSGSATGSGWTNPSNATASDNAYATYAIAAASTCSKCVDPTITPRASTQISISSLGFAVPASATITGITVTFEHKCSGTSSCSTSTDDGGRIRLTKTAATPQGTNKGSATFWGTSDSTETLGGDSDLWGSTWTVSEVNASGFGLAVVVINSNTGGTRTAYIDAMAITVTYSPSGSGSHRRVVISQTRSAKIHG